jgi:enoyl-CoA hydratase/carnithine racemase
MFRSQTGGLVLELTMSHAPANAVNREWIEAFDAVLDDLARQPDINTADTRNRVKAFLDK